MRHLSDKSIVSNLGKDEKTVIVNFGYLSLLQVAGYLFPLITVPYLARVIGTDGFGNIAFAAAIIVWVQTVSDWGFNYTATRDVAQNVGDRYAVSRIFSDVLWARCLLMIVSFLFLLLLTIIIPSFHSHSKIILVSFLLVPGYIMFPEWFFQAIEKMKYTTLFNLLIKLLFTVAVFLFIKQPDDYLLQPLFTAIGYMVCGVLSLWLILVKWGYKIYPPSFSRIGRALRNSTDVFINNIMPNFYNSFSVLLLGSYAGNAATGIFDGGNRFLTVTNQFQSVISRVFFPYLSRKVENHSLFVTINLTVGLLFSALLFVFSPFIVKVMLGPDFMDSIIVLRILSVSLFFIALSNSYGTNYLIIVHRERDLRRITVFSSKIGMLIAFPLVNHYSYIGVALTLLISRALIGTLAFICAKMSKK